MINTQEGQKALTDGLWKFKMGRKTSWLCVKDGVLWLPIAAMHPIIAMTSGREIMFVGKRGFMRASDFMEECPSQKETIEKIAEKHGLKL